jgi:hypothetical protein
MAADPMKRKRPVYRHSPMYNLDHLLLQEMLVAEKAGRNVHHHQSVDIDELLDDPDLERLHAERLQQLQREAEKRAKLYQQGHGTYDEVQEGDFLEIVTTSERVVCHFFHREFERCRILDMHLSNLATSHLETRFIKLSAPVRKWRSGQSVNGRIGHETKQLMTSTAAGRPIFCR